MAHRLKQRFNFPKRKFGGSPFSKKNPSKKTAFKEIRKWKNPDAARSAAQLIKNFGKPIVASGGIIRWNNVPEYNEVWIRDESIKHSFPVPHTDNLYSSRHIPEWKPKEGKSTVNPELAKKFSAITGSIIIDGLKGKVTARCEELVKNAVTIGFVEDVVKGKAPATREEYSRRIINNITPKWFKDRLNEV